MKRYWIIVLALVAGGSLAAQAKRPNTREGFWWGLGLGWGVAGESCADCAGDQLSGLAGNLRLGGTVSPSVLIGAETNGWYRSDGDDDRALSFGSAVVVIYPSPTGAFYLKAGLGLMSYFAETSQGDLTARAGAAILGAGYDFRVGRNVSVVAFLNSLASTETEYELDGASAGTGITMTLFQLGVGVTWH